jgi:hypothetical protein
MTGTKGNTGFNVLNDTIPDPKSGLVYSLMENHYGAAGKVQEVRSDFDISPKHCVGNGFYLCRNSFLYGESLFHSTKEKFK